MISPGAALRAVIFDCDGLLADTQACWNAAYSRGAAHYGVDLPPGQLEQLRGSSIDTAAEFVTAQAGRNGSGSRSADTAAVARRLHDELLAAIDNTELRLLPGVEQTLDRLLDMPRAVASNAPRAVLQRVLQRLNVDRIFPLILSADDVRAPKPAPDIYRLACARLGVSPSKALALEDSLPGIAAALAAGLEVLAVTGELAMTPASFTVRRLDEPSAQSWLQERLRAGSFPHPAEADLSRGG